MHDMGITPTNNGTFTKAKCSTIPLVQDLVFENSEGSKAVSIQYIYAHK